LNFISQTLKTFPRICCVILICVWKRLLADDFMLPTTPAQLPLNEHEPQSC
jgi:hypothetical protein